MAQFFLGQIRKLNGRNKLDFTPVNQLQNIFGQFSQP
jgi:hypothetical protein